MKTNVLETIEKVGLISIAAVSEPEQAVLAAQGTVDGGVDVVAFPCRDANSTAAIAAVRKALPDVAIGAVFALDAATVDAAVAAGADFVLTPGFDAALVEYCNSKGVAIIPGATTATEIELGVKLGLNVFGFFPAKVAGGLDAMKTFASAFKGVRFVPFGCVDMSDVKTFSESSAVFAVASCDAIAPVSLVAAGDRAGIAANSKRAVELSLGLTMGHVGINCESSDEANSTAKWFFDVFGLAPRETAISFFSGSAVESMKSPSFGAKGHIGIATNSAVRAIWHMERKGIEFRAIKRGPDGSIIAAYLTAEIGGFAVHLCPKY